MKTYLFSWKLIIFNQSQAFETSTWEWNYYYCYYY